MNYFIFNRDRIGGCYFVMFFLYFISRLILVVLFGLDCNIYVVVIFLMSTIYILASFKITNYDLFFIFLVAWMSLILIFRMVYEAPILDVNNVNQFDLIENSLGNIVLYYFVGRAFIHYNVLNFVQKYINYLVSLFIVVLIQFVYYSFPSGEVDYNAISQKMNNGWVSHLHFGSTLVLLSFMIISSIRRSNLFIFIPISIYLFLLLGGRSALIFYATSLYLMFAFCTFQNRFFIKFLLVGIPLIFSIVIFYLLFVNDPSFNDRLYLFSRGEAHIYEQLLIGDPVKILLYADSYGAYIHNILGSIQIFGLPLFLGMLFLLLIVGFRFFSVKVYLLNGQFIFVGLLFVYSVISILLTKFFSEWIFWFALGAAVSYINLNINSSDKVIYKDKV